MAEAMRHHGWGDAVVVGCSDSIVPAIDPTVNEQNNAGEGSGGGKRGASSKKGGSSWASSSSRSSAGLSSFDDKKKKKKKAAHGKRKMAKMTVGELSFNERVQQNQAKVAHKVGLVNDPSRVITADDYIIFVSKTSTPSLAHRKDRKDWATLAKPFVKEVLNRLKVKQAKSTAKRQHILVCGWRPEWDSEPERFYNRVTDISSGLATGSVITCLNSKEFTVFEKLMDGLHGTSLDVGASFGAGSGFSGGFERMDSYTDTSPMPDGGRGRRSQEAPQPSSSSLALKLHNPSSWTINDPSVLEGISVLHYSADPTNYDHVAPLLQSELSFDTAICLGSMPGKNLAPAARDARVLSMLLVLRSLAKQKKGMHVIAENQQDQTSGLAVCPSTGPSHEPDFINTQAIIARSLVQNLAYPQMQEALGELLVHGEKDSADLDFLTPYSCGIAKKEVVAIGVVQRIILELYQSSAQCIGYFKGAKLFLNPKASEKVRWSAKHRIIVIVRGGTEIDPDGRSKKKGSSTGASSDDDVDDAEDYAEDDWVENDDEEDEHEEDDHEEDEDTDEEDEDTDEEDDHEEEEEEEGEGHEDHREEGAYF